AVEAGRLARDAEQRAAAPETIGDDVHERLRFAGACRAGEGEALAADRHLDALPLARIGLKDEEAFLRLDVDAVRGGGVAVELLKRGGAAGSGRQNADQRMRRRLL